MIELIIFLSLLVGLFVVLGMWGEMNSLDQREEQERIRNSIKKDAQWGVSRGWIVEGARK